MLARPLVGDILRDEGLTRGLGDPEARFLVEWLIDQGDRLAARDLPHATAQVRRLCRRGRAVACFVRLWCYEGSRRSAIQLAATERFGWPLPNQTVDPCELMQTILGWEAQQLTTATGSATSSPWAA
jgi:hypothetical protein